ncbi:hypothetical protein K1T71_003388 [Dendrolimus kikuchii]|uniref:Uncharacterized protein n=1 Tax=Dendrolimus kikuchii TaxID=765133 RepID=A0ACC1DCH1_9NEOP|nr:hypothetical protein K1T71_003388 [Dendrolimus kikuchii]
MATNEETLSDADKDFIAQCEEEFKHRYTDDDQEFMKVFNSEPSKPPIVDPWYVSHNSGRRNDRRNRRDHPYERYGNRSGGRGYHNQRDDRQGYRTFDNRRQGYQRQRHY